MAFRNSHTDSEDFMSDFKNERSDRKKGKGEKEKQTSKDEINNERKNQGFQVQSLRDYNVYSDVENVLNLNPVSYIDHVKPLPDVRYDTKTSEVKKSLENPLTTNINRIQHPSVSTISKTAAHIIGPAPPSKPAAPVKRQQRRDDSDRNYYESVALNEEVNILFGDKKADDTCSVSKFHLFN